MFFYIFFYVFSVFQHTASNYVFTIILADKLLLSGTVANVTAWILSTLISFVLFRYLYFDRTDNSFINELIKFASARIFTLGVETVSVLVFVDLLHMDLKIVKAILIPVTAILNYFISKLFVFKNKNS